MKFILIFLIIVGFSISGCGSGEKQHDETIAYWTCPMHPEIKEDHKTTCPICGMDLAPVRYDNADEQDHNEHSDAKIEHWTCPMHPEIEDDQPGSCPICGMDLVPVHAAHDGQDDPAASRALRITPVQQQIIGMQYDTVKARSLQWNIRTIGRIFPDERRVTEVTLRVMGYVEKTHVNETGVQVRRGQPLVTVYSPDLVSSQQDYLVALRGNNQRLAERGRERLRLLNMPESEIRRLEESGEPLLEVTITAPFDGTILKKGVRDGMKIMPGMMLYEIADLSTVWLIVDVYEDDIPFIYTGQKTIFKLQGTQGDREGQVTFIYPTIDPMTRTLRVRIEISNRNDNIRVDQYGWVTFVQDLGERLSVHRDAVLTTGKRSVVFKEVGRGRFEPVEVHLGPLAGNYYELLYGLKDGDRIITSGRFFLDAESRLRGTGAMEGHGH